MEAPETQGKRTVFMILVSSCVFLCAESQKMEAISGQYVDLYLFVLSASITDLICFIRAS